jgi:hypothetical protein
MVNKDTIESEQKGLLLTDANTTVAWDEEYFDAALKILGRLPRETRAGILKEILQAGLMKPKVIVEDTMATKELVTRIEELTADKISLSTEKVELTKKLSDAISLADSRETERQQLFEENVKLKACVLSAKASMIVDCESKLAAETLTDETRKAKVEEIMKTFSDEVGLDKKLSEVVALIKKPESQKVVAGGPADMLKDTRPDPVTPNQVPHKKEKGKTIKTVGSLAALRDRAVNTTD